MSLSIGSSRLQKFHSSTLVLMPQATTTKTDNLIICSSADLSFQPNTVVPQYNRVTEFQNWGVSPIHLVIWINDFDPTPTECNDAFLPAQQTVNAAYLHRCHHTNLPFQYAPTLYFHTFAVPTLAAAAWPNPPLCFDPQQKQCPSH